jgi:hypothetical protein
MHDTGDGTDAGRSGGVVPALCETYSRRSLNPDIMHQPTRMGTSPFVGLSVNRVRTWPSSAFPLLAQR